MPPMHGASKRGLPAGRQAYPSALRLWIILIRIARIPAISNAGRTRIGSDPSPVVGTREGVTVLGTRTASVRRIADAPAPRGRSALIGGNATVRAGDAPEALSSQPGGLPTCPLMYRRFRAP